MPPRKVLGVGAQIRTGFEERVIILQIQVVALQVHGDEDRRYRGWELTEGVVAVLRLQGYQLAERLIMHLGGATHEGALLPWPRRGGMEGAARPKLALT